MTVVVGVGAFLFGAGIRLGRRTPPPLRGVVAASAAMLLALGFWEHMPSDVRWLCAFVNLCGAPMLGGVLGAMFPEGQSVTTG